MKEGFVCKRTFGIIIDGVKGDFYGPVNKITKEPQDCGILLQGDWIQCGSSFSPKLYVVSRRLIINQRTLESKLVVTKKFPGNKKVEKVLGYFRGD